MNENELLRQFTLTCSELVELAEKIGEKNWAKNFFHSALKALQNTTMPVRQRLEEAYNRTGVFGGMGSWNDSPPYSAYLHQQTEAYDRLSNQLYECRKAVVVLYRSL